jgi:hypothetical protein
MDFWALNAAIRYQEYFRDMVTDAPVTSFKLNVRFRDAGCPPSVKPNDTRCKVRLTNLHMENPPQQCTAILVFITVINQSLFAHDF